MSHSLFRKISIVRILMARPLLILAFSIAFACFFILPQHLSLITKFILVWDAGTALYLALAVHMMSQSTEPDMRKNASNLDEGELSILGLTIFGALASLAAIMHELSSAKSLIGHLQEEAILLAVVTVLLTWIFMQTMFALHYAHAYYNSNISNEVGGLDFPSSKARPDSRPDYWDFIYFSFIIGTAAQTADVNITSKVIRRVVTIQCVTVFFFNTTILALAINVGASLI